MPPEVVVTGADFGQKGGAHFRSALQRLPAQFFDVSPTFRGHRVFPSGLSQYREMCGRLQ
jgi:hypothetical protein